MGAEGIRLKDSEKKPAGWVWVQGTDRFRPARPEDFQDRFVPGVVGSIYALSPRERLRRFRRRLFHGMYFLLPVKVGSGHGLSSVGIWHVGIAGKLFVSDGCVWWCDGRWFSNAGGNLKKLGRYRAPRLQFFAPPPDFSKIKTEAEFLAERDGQG